MVIKLITLLSHVLRITGSYVLGADRQNFFGLAKSTRPGLQLLNIYIYIYYQISNDGQPWVLH